MRKILSRTAAVLIVLLGLSFASLNYDKAERLNLYVAQVELPIAVWLVLAIALGAAAGVFSTLGIILRQRREMRRWRRKANDAQKELSELRKLPIRDQP